MWLGLLLRDDTDGDSDLVTLCAWGTEPTTAIRITGAPSGMAQCARLLRTTLAFGSEFASPRCPSCRAPLDVPDYDAAVHEEAA